jgi:hypothetical protein
MIIKQSFVQRANKIKLKEEINLNEKTLLAFRAVYAVVAFGCSRQKFSQCDNKFSGFRYGKF